MMPKMLRPDAKGRITLGQLANGISGFLMTETEDHKIILEPYAEIPLNEKWLYENKAALNAVKQGLKEAAAGKVSEMGDFTKYIEDDIEK